MMNRIAFRDLVLRYKVVFFDAYGVLKNYKGLIPGIAQTFDFLKENGVDFYVLTNDASRSPQALAQRYQDEGIAAITDQKIISSGMIAREYLRLKLDHGTIAYLGTEDSAHYVETVGLKTVSVRDLNLEDVSQVRALVLLDDEGFDWAQDLNKAINLLRMQNMPVVVANTDRAYPVSRNEVAMAVGSLANMIERVVQKKFLRFGKPDTQMFNFAYEHILNQKFVTKREILMVGDTLLTDILGGNKFGIDTTLVLSGNTLPDKAELMIESTGIIPDFICESAVVQPENQVS